MTRDELNRLISLGEGQTLEFKRSASEDFGREMVAFANSLGGIILIGKAFRGIRFFLEYFTGWTLSSMSGRA